MAPELLIDAGAWTICARCGYGVPADEVETCLHHGEICTECRENANPCRSKDCDY